MNHTLLNLAESLLDDHHPINFNMQGFSMYPTLREGDRGIVEKWNTEELLVGDIIVFKANHKLVAHRLVRIEIREGVRLYIAKGDKNNFTDEPFTSEALVGKMTSFQRKNSIKTMDSPSMKVRAFIFLHFSKVLIPFHNLCLRAGNRINSIHTGWQSIKKNLSVITRHSGKELSLNLIIAALQGILPFVIIVCIKLLIDYLTKPSAMEVSQQLYFISLLILTAFVFLMNGVLSELKGYYSEKLSQSVTRRIYTKLHTKHSSLDLSHYENPAEQDKIHRAVQEASFRPIKIINELVTGVRSVAAGLFMVALFANIRWYLVALLVISIIPGVIIRLKYSRKLYKLKESQSTREREMYYYNRILTGFPFAKELKLFGFTVFFLKRFSNTQDRLFDQKIKLSKSELRLEIFSQCFAIILIFISLGYVSYLKLHGEITIGTVVLFFFAFQRGYSVLNDFFRSITQIMEDNTFLNDFMAFLNMPVRSEVQPDMQQPFSLNKSIRIENVSFRYESSTREVLKAVNITIPAGKTVAFVGANGSGKTTLIKLLCGFYQPNAGSITFDGVDSLSIGQKLICENITAVFQDFALYNIPAIENIGLGNVQTEFNLDKAKKAASDAGIAEVIERLPDGYLTLLGNLFKGGEELSIGQWQKIAIARAFYRDSPLILMDEPSSALDASSEFQIIKSLKALSSDKTAVIISHRLSTVQWADLIYLFDKGEVLESGNHTDLMALKGKYYTLFQTANNPVDED
ncbi:MAG: signal peptidase I [Paludibacter sp.]|nr:signal peptidase I [Paludibacter sp.]